MHDQQARASRTNNHSGLDLHYLTYNERVYDDSSIDLDEEGLPIHRRTYKISHIIEQ